MPINSWVENKNGSHRHVAVQTSQKQERAYTWFPLYKV